MKPLTDAQRRQLEEVEADRVRWAPYEFRYWSTVFPPAIRSDVVRRLVDRGLAEVGEKVGTLSSRRVVITNSGVAALSLPLPTDWETHGMEELDLYARHLDIDVDAIIERTGGLTKPQLVAAIAALQEARG